MISVRLFMIVFGVLFACKTFIAAQIKPTYFAVKLMQRSSIFAPSAAFPHTNALLNMKSIRTAVMPDHIPIHEISRKRRALQLTSYTVKLIQKGSVFAPSAAFPHTNVLWNMKTNRSAEMPDYIPIHET